MRSTWRESIALGLYRAAKASVQLLPSQVLRFRPFGVFEIALSDRPSDSAPDEADGTSVEVRWIVDQQEFEQLTGLVDESNVQTWDGATRRVAAAWCEGQPVGVLWVAVGGFAEPELGLNYRLNSDEAWLFAAVVDPAQRRRGIHTKLLSFVIDELAKSGFKRLLLGVAHGNEASLRSHTRIGAQQVGSVVAARSLGISFCKTQGQVERLSPTCCAWRRMIEVSIDD